MLQSVFRRALWQTDGLIGSISALLAHELTVPDHTMPSRRPRAWMWFAFAQARV
jgi:hypothetical protein